MQNLNVPFEKLKRELNVYRTLVHYSFENHFRCCIQINNPLVCRQPNKVTSSTASKE